MFFFAFVLLLIALALPYSGHAANVTFIWDDPLGSAQGYILERKIGLDGTYAEITDPLARPTAKTWTDENVPVVKNVSLCYTAFAFNELGKSRPSNEVCLAMPNAPVNIRMVLETFGPSETVPRVSVRTRVRKK